MNSSRARASTGDRIVKVFRSVTGEPAQRFLVNAGAAALVLLSLALAFSDATLSFFSAFTDRPELLPISLLVPYMWLIFQVLLHRIEREEVDERLELAFQLRKEQIEPRRQERAVLVNTFERSIRGCQSLGTERSKVALADWIAERRASDVLKIQMLSYSSETFLNPVVEAARIIAQDIQSGGPCPKEVRLDLLMRDLREDWPIPVLRQFEVDRQYLSALKSRFRQHLDRWVPEIEDAYGQFLLVKDIHIKFKAYSGEPLLKGVMVNEEVGLIGVYDFGRVEQDGVEGWDYHGHGAGMFCASALPSASEQEVEAFRLLQSTFQSTWDRSVSIGR